MNKRVETLFTPGQNQWDTDLIIDMFDERGINLIYAMSFSTFEKDSWYWKKEKLGCYTVKSAYALVQEGWGS